jgi:acyl-CoA synthetase (AMP-forming)/AMP-acid ligase II
VPVAVVVAHGRVDPEELQGWIAARVGRHERPAAVVLADRIPRTPAGKILRRKLRPLTG